LQKGKESKCSGGEEDKEILAKKSRDVNALISSIEREKKEKNDKKKIIFPFKNGFTFVVVAIDSDLITSAIRLLSEIIIKKLNNRINHIAFYTGGK
jgi:hypothetical protein